MAATKGLPTLAGGSLGLSRYLEEIRKFPMLAPDEEYMLAKRWLKRSIGQPSSTTGGKKAEKPAKASAAKTKTSKTKKSA